jgi:PPOX class probable F420-dependent enzyme
LTGIGARTIDGRPSGEHSVNRRSQIALSADEQAQYLRESKTIILCTIDPHGYPHAVAMWYWAEDDGTVLMTTYGKSQKVLNIRRNPKVTLLVESGEAYDKLKGIMIRGTAEIIDDLDQCVGVLVNIHRKMGGAMAEGLEEIMKANARKRVVMRVTPVHVSSWDHGKLGAGVY